MRGSEGPEYHQILVDCGKARATMTERVVVHDERLLACVGLMTHNNAWEVPAGVVAIYLERREDPMMKDLQVGICPPAIVGAHTNTLRYQLLKFVALAVLNEEKKRRDVPTCQ